MLSCLRGDFSLDCFRLCILEDKVVIQCWWCYSIVRIFCILNKETSLFTCIFGLLHSSSCNSKIIRQLCFFLSLLGLFELLRDLQSLLFENDAWIFALQDCCASLESHVEGCLNDKQSGRSLGNFRSYEGQIIFA